MPAELNHEPPGTGGPPRRQGVLRVRDLARQRVGPWITRTHPQLEGPTRGPTWHPSNSAALQGTCERHWRDQAPKRQSLRRVKSFSRKLPCSNFLGGRARVLVLVSCLSSLPAASPCPAGEVRLAWDPVHDSRVAVYELHYGPSTKAYHLRRDTTATSLTVDGLDQSRRYYFAVRACTADHSSCSAFSNEICAAMPDTPQAPVEVCDPNRIPLEALPSRGGWRVVLDEDYP